LIYLDASALAKLILDENESPALRRFLSDHSTLITSTITRVELTRAIRRAAPSQLSAAHRRMDSLVFLHLTESLLDSAGMVGAVALRTLDAIHLASALTVRSELDALVAYDKRLLDAASALGLPTACPT
jgi:predicted nucleic acid-binding protein